MSDLLPVVYLARPGETPWGGESPAQIGLRR